MIIMNHLDYKEVGTCTEADYIGYKREKILD